MIQSVSLENFRGFSKHFLPLGPMTVIVGENNAGKTTIVEALRLVSFITLRYKNYSFKYPPPTSDIPRVYMGIAPSTKNLEINFNTIFHRYSDPPAIITANFVNGVSIVIYILSEGAIHAVIKDSFGEVVKDGRQSKSIDIPSVMIMPQVSPLQRQEKILSEDYVRGAISSRLAPLHFRNQLKIMNDMYPHFKSVVEDTWPGVQVRELGWQNDFPGEDLYLEIRNENFVAEIAEMGHGLQMWLQIMWFLTRAKKASTVILDEPDVYMHADLQRRIIRYIKDKHSQAIVTTHSAEIMSEVQTDEILVVDKNQSESGFAGSIPAVQTALQNLGSIHNLNVSRLMRAKKMVIVEGYDLKILGLLQDKVFPCSSTPFQALPNMSIGGWGGWKLAVGGSMIFHNALGEHIKCYCIFDSDYHSELEIAKRYSEAKEKNVQIHIWRKKEIENYLLLPEAISRFIGRRVSDQDSMALILLVKRKILELADVLENEIFDSLSDEYLRVNRGIGVSRANANARLLISDVRQKEGNIVSMASGKLLFSMLSEWSKSVYGVSFSVYNIAREVDYEELPKELVEVITAIEKGLNFQEYK